MSEDVSFRRVLRVAEWTGAAVYFVHVSAQQGLNSIREARSRGLPVYGETLLSRAAGCWARRVSKLSDSVRLSVKGKCHPLRELAP